MSGLPYPTNQAPAQPRVVAADRASDQEVEASVAMVTAHPLVRALLDATDVSVVVLNRQRQILVGNSALLASLRDDALDFHGLRPGEALGCILAGECPGGCGTGPGCSFCGAALAIVECQRTGETVERDCLMTVRRDEETTAQELHVKASPLELGGKSLTVVGFRDVSAEKRRDALERVFLHDISNTVSPLVNWAHVLSARAEGASAELAPRIEALARRLQREIDDQRALVQAERGTLALRRAAVDPLSALEKAAAILAEEWAAKRRFVEVDRRSRPDEIETDESLLLRVLVNMIKNALEATPDGGTARACVRATPDGCEFRVWNEGAIPPETALQIFKRSFSTKAGLGRGLGTFSMKLFGERYLGGVVGFDSAAESGTTFYLRLPRAVPR